MSVTGNESTALARIFAEVPTFGYALAMGKDTFADMGDRVFRATLSDTSIECDIVGALYDDVRNHATAVGLAKQKPMKDQSQKSRNSQVSKLRNFPELAIYAQDNDDVTPVYETARTLSGGGYTKLVGCLVAMKRELARNPRASAKVLDDAVRASLAKEAEKPSEAVAKIADAWEALAYGTDKEPAPFPAAFAGLLASENADLAKRVSEVLARIQHVFEQAEKLAEPPPVLSA